MALMERYGIRACVISRCTRMGEYKTCGHSVASGIAYLVS